MKFKGDVHYEHEQVLKTGILLCNLGTPDACENRAIKRYLREFLSDRRVIEVNPLLWKLLLNLVILPFRTSKSTMLYKKIWTKDGSPLLLTSRQFTDRLQKKFNAQFGEDVFVELGMRYGNPSITEALERLRIKHINKLIVLPLYPQYSATTTASTFDRVVDTLKTWRLVPEVRFIQQFYNACGYINALVSSIEECWGENGKPERLIISFHGIPKSYVEKGDPYYYFCNETARLIKEKLSFEEDNILICFQSRFGPKEWLTPYTDKTIKELAEKGIKDLDIVCPGFTVDCLETLEEIAVQNREVFINSGGRRYRYIRALNIRDDFLDFVFDLLVMQNLSASS